MVDVVSDKHFKLSQTFRRTLATYREAEDLINIGAYVKGSNPDIDFALEKYNLMQNFVNQEMRETSKMEECEVELEKMFK